MVKWRSGDIAASRPMQRFRLWIGVIPAREPCPGPQPRPFSNPTFLYFFHSRVASVSAVRTKINNAAVKVTSNQAACSPVAATTWKLGRVGSLTEARRSVGCPLSREIVREVTCPNNPFETKSKCHMVSALPAQFLHGRGTVDLNSYRSIVLPFTSCDRHEVWWV